MIEDGKFVRYDVGTPDRVAPGGGGQYLRVPAEASQGWLVFETDASGEVTSWRAGVTSQVDYIEGCA